MNLWDLMAGFRRRWYLMLVVIAAAVGLPLLTANLVKPSYEASASILLLPPPTEVNGVVTNPYLDLSNLGPAVDVLSGSLTTQNAQKAIRKVAGDTKYTVAPDPSSSAPVVLISTSGATSTGAKTALTTLVTMAPTELRTIQDRSAVRAEAYITSAVIAQDKSPQVVQKARIRAVLAVFIAVMVLGLVLVTFLDDVLFKRRSRRLGLPYPEAPSRGREEGGDAGPLSTAGDSEVAARPEPRRQRRRRASPPVRSDRQKPESNPSSRRRVEASSVGAGSRETFESNGDGVSGSTPASDAKRSRRGQKRTRA